MLPENGLADIWEGGHECEQSELRNTMWGAEGSLRRDFPSELLDGFSGPGPAG